MVNACIASSTMNVITAALCLIWMHPCHSECPNRLIPHLFSATNRALLKHVLRWKTASSPVICGRDCSMDPQCTSFNYHISNRVCELNNATRAHSPADFVELQGSAYYDDNLDTLSISIPGDTSTSSSVSTPGDTSPSSSVSTPEYTSSSDSVSKTADISFSSCKLFFQAGYRDNGIYTIFPSAIPNGLQVYCDMETDGGGWIVIQRRQDGSVDFARTWSEYQIGFGNMHTEFWLGNDILRDLTGSGQWELRVDLEDWDGNTLWAAYGAFAVTGNLYTLVVRSYDPASTTGDSMTEQNGVSFSTKDRDNDDSTGFCALSYSGAWWFDDCYKAHLNGIYYNQPVNNGYGHGISWYYWNHNNKNGWYYSLKACSMAIRQVNN